ncbi:hypothetical protein BB934_26385 [Microvirga ossetica]|uniref:Uncharacterized protein n=1 Tax=Microvirga ossetica TaxID=1882682 RepID=A0A1B2EMW1_9HYPH|nr:hypothetical protein [Microvirga ossetica]ANY81313.1 hypothetical protein BB934_26385 [Microvirga ossetica]
MAHGLRKIVEVLDEHAQAGDGLSITLLTISGQVMNFSDDNWRSLTQSVDELISSEADEDTYVVIVRRPDEKPAPGKIPLKTIAGFVVSKAGILTLSAEEIREAIQTGNQTGKRIPPEPSARFTDGLSLLPELRGFALDADAPGGGNGSSLH